jgi:UDP-GlcNAc:undecaprenyl-phosphate GlcNAc-1-phosphate transferase
VTLFFLPFLFSFSVAILLSLVFSLPFFRFRQTRTGSRHARSGTLSRLGGVAMMIAFLMVVGIDPHLVLTRPLWGLFAGSIFIFLFGIVDDFFPLDWKTQLFFQVALGSIVYFFAIRIDFITNPFGGIIDFSQSSFPGLPFLVTLLWLLLLINAVNWLDGADGLLGSAGGIAALTIFLISLRPEVNQPPIAIVSLALFGAILGFLIFNLPPARILAGTTGSMFVGFALAALSMIAGSKIATTMLVLAVPIIDALVVMFSRLFSGESLFQPDERHIHFRLMRLGWSPMRIFFAVTLFTSLIAAVALLVPTALKAVAFLSLCCFFVAFFFWLGRAAQRN